MNHKIYLLLWLCLVFSFEVPGFGQVYNFSAPVDQLGYDQKGFIEIAFSDPYNPNTYAGSGRYPGTGQEVKFGTFTGSLIYDPAAQTMRVTGSVPVSATTFNLGFTDTQTVNGVQVPVTVSVNAGLVNASNGSLLIDTGVLQATPHYDFGVAIPLVLSGTYSVMTGGQTYSSNFTETLDFGTDLVPRSISPTNINFTDDMFPGGFYIPPSSIGTITASNGVQVHLSGIDPNDTVTYLQWSMEGVNATAQVPETLGLVFPACAMIGLVAVHRRLRRQVARS